MRRTLLLVLPLGLLILGAGLWLVPAWSGAEPPTVKPAEPPPGKQAASLPITGIKLFSSGVAHVQRQGEVQGNERIVLAFAVRDVNDLLKSLEVEDLNGGRVGTVGYSSQDPVERTLQSYTINLAANPSFAQVLGQARGEKVEVQVQPAAGQPAQVTGAILGVETQKQSGGKETTEVSLLNLWCAEGLRNLKLAEVQRIRFLNPVLEGDVKRVLDLLAQVHNTQQKSLTLNCTGQGKRTVKVGYVVEHPIWKTSYRVLLSARDKPQFRAWAMVENPSDEDWKDVRLSLISGRPLSFRMDLYPPLYVPRPLVEPELFAGLRPPTYSGPLEPQPKPGGPVKIPELPEVPPPPPKTPPLSPALPIRTASSGDSFLYVLDDPVSLPRQQSVLVPLVRKEVEGIKVSIYNESVNAKHPLLGLRLKNTTGMPLPQGPLTVYEEGTYAGDARIPDLQPNEERLLSYAIDLGTEVAAQPRGQTQRLTNIKIVKGIIYAQTKEMESKTYVAKNRSGQERRLVIEHPYRPEFKLMTEQKPAEMTRDVYRFEVKVGADKTVLLEVPEERMRAQAVVLSNTDDQMLRFYLHQQVLSPIAKAALEKAIGLRQKWTGLQKQVQAQERDLKQRLEDQARVRANLGRVSKEQEVYKRYLKKLDEMENELEKLQVGIRALQDDELKERKEFEDFLAGLTVE